MAYTICVSQLLQEIPSFFMSIQEAGSYFPVNWQDYLNEYSKANFLSHIQWLENKNKIVCFVKCNMTFNLGGWGMIRSLAFGAVAFRED